MNNLNQLEKASFRITNWIGTPGSILIHTLVFMLFTALVIEGVDFNKVMLIWNTSVSLEAIYLALFIQMTVNRHTESLEELEEDVEDISEDIEDIQEEDVKPSKGTATLDHIEVGLQRLIQEVETLKAHKKIPQKTH